jgi:rhamnulokinase
MDSLALAYRRAIRGISHLTGVRVDAVHIVGGGALNEVLCQLTADACGVEVVAGPVEAAAIGNALMQLEALGAVEHDIHRMRALVASSFPTKRFQPVVSDARDWDRAESLVEAARQAR